MPPRDDEENTRFGSSIREQEAATAAAAKRSLPTPEQVNARLSRNPRPSFRYSSLPTVDQMRGIETSRLRPPIEVEFAGDPKELALKQQERRLENLIQQRQMELINETPAYQRAFGLDQTAEPMGFFRRTWSTATFAYKSWDIKEDIIEKELGFIEEEKRRIRNTLRFGEFLLSIPQTAAMALTGGIIAGFYQPLKNTYNAATGQPAEDIRWQSDSLWWKILYGRETERDIYGRVIPGTRKGREVRSVTALQKDYQQALMEFQGIKPEDREFKDNIMPILVSTFGAPAMMVLDALDITLVAAPVSKTITGISATKNLTRGIMQGIEEVLTSAGKNLDEAVMKEAREITKAIIKEKNPLTAQRRLNEFLLRQVGEDTAEGRAIRALDAGINQEIAIARTELDRLALEAPDLPTFRTIVEESIRADRIAQARAVSNALSDAVTEPTFIAATQRVDEIFREFGTGLDIEDVLQGQLVDDAPDAIREEFEGLVTQLGEITANTIDPLKRQLTSLTDAVPLGQGPFDLTRNLLLDQEKKLPDLLEEVFNAQQGRFTSSLQAANSLPLTSINGNQVVNALQRVQRQLAANRVSGRRGMTSTQRMADYLNADDIARGAFGRRALLGVGSAVDDAIEMAAKNAPRVPEARKPSVVGPTTPINQQVFTKVDLSQSDTLLKAADDAARADTFEEFVQNSDEVVYQSDDGYTYVRDVNYSNKVNADQEVNPPVVLDMKMPLVLNGTTDLGRPDSFPPAIANAIRGEGVRVEAGNAIEPAVAARILEEARLLGFDGVIYNRMADGRLIEERMVPTTGQVIPASFFYDNIKGGKEIFGEGINLALRRQSQVDDVLRTMLPENKEYNKFSSRLKDMGVPEQLADDIVLELHAFMVDQYVRSLSKTPRFQRTRGFNRRVGNAMIEMVVDGKGAAYRYSNQSAENPVAFMGDLLTGDEVKTLYRQTAEAFEADAKKRADQLANARIAGTPTEKEFIAKGPGHKRFYNSIQKRVREGVILPEEAALIRSAFKDIDDKFLRSVPATESSADYVRRGLNGTYNQATNKITLARGLSYQALRGGLQRGRDANMMNMGRLGSETFFHEFGHLGHKILLSKQQQRVVTEVYNSFSKRELRRLFRRDTGRIGMESYYAKNEDEFFAQAFAQYVLRNQMTDERLLPLFERITNQLKASLTNLFRSKNNVENGKLDPLIPMFDQILRGQSAARNQAARTSIKKKANDLMSQEMTGATMAKISALRKTAQNKATKQDLEDFFSTNRGDEPIDLAEVGKMKKSEMLALLADNYGEDAIFDVVEQAGKDGGVYFERSAQTPNMNPDDANIPPQRIQINRQAIERNAKLLQATSLGVDLPDSIRKTPLGSAEELLTLADDMGKQPPKTPKDIFQRGADPDSVYDAKVVKNINKIDPKDPKLAAQLQPQAIFGKNTKVPRSLRQGQTKLAQTMAKIQKQLVGQDNRFVKAVETLKASRAAAIQRANLRFATAEAVRKELVTALKAEAAMLDEFGTGFTAGQTKRIAEMISKTRTNTQLRKALESISSMADDQLRAEARTRIGTIISNVKNGTRNIPPFWQEKIEDRIGETSISLKLFKEDYRKRLEKLQEFLDENPDEKLKFKSPKTLRMLEDLEELEKRSISDFETDELVELVHDIEQIYEQGEAAQFVLKGGKTKKITRDITKVDANGKITTEKFVVQEGGIEVMGLEELRIKGRVAAIEEAGERGDVSNMDVGTVTREYGKLEAATISGIWDGIKNLAIGTDRRNAWNRALMSYLTSDRTVNLMDKMDPNGVIYRTMLKPIREAVNRGERAGVKATTGLINKEKELIKKYNLVFGQQADDLGLVGAKSVASKAISSGFSDANYERIAIWAYHQQGLTRKMENVVPKKDIDAVVNGGLKPWEKEMYEYMRDELDKLYPKVDEVMRDVHGTRIERIENYFPIQTNVLDARTMEEVLNIEYIPNKRAVARGFTKERYDIANNRIQMNARDIFRKHVRDVNYFTEVEPTLQQVAGMARDEGFRKTMGDNAGLWWESYLDIIARRGTPKNYDFNWSDTARKNLGAATLGLNISPWLKQPLAFFAGIGLVGPKHAFLNGHRLMHQYGLFDAIGDVSIEQALRAADDPVYTELRVSGKIEKMQDMGYYAIKKTDAWTARGVWMAAYTKKLEEKKKVFDPENFKNGIGIDQEALDYADMIVRKTQGSGKFQDLPLFLTNKDKRLFTFLFQFQSFVLSQSQLLTHDAFYSVYASAVGKSKIPLKDATGAAVTISASIGVATWLEQEITRGLTNAYGSENAKEWQKENGGAGSRIHEGIKSAFPPYGTASGFIDDNMNTNVPIIDKILQTGVSLSRARGANLDTLQGQETAAKETTRVIANVISLAFGIPGTSFAQQMIQNKGIERAYSTPAEELTAAYLAGDQAEYDLLVRQYAERGLDMQELSDKVERMVKSEAKAERKDEVDKILEMWRKADTPRKRNEVRDLVDEGIRNGTLTQDHMKDIESALRSDARLESIGER